MNKINKEKITIFILAGRKNFDEGPLKWVEDTKLTLVEDFLEKIKTIDSIDNIIISSNDVLFLKKIALIDKRIVIDKIKDNETKKFHFGKWLKERIIKYNPHHLIYWGSGASPFITTEIIEGFIVSIISGNSILYTNNFFSSDWVAFTPAKSFLEINPPLLDNNLAYALWKEVNFRSIYIEPTIEIIGDIDTPADLLVLSEHPKTSSNTKKYLKSLSLDTRKVLQFSKLLKERNKIFLSGRVGSSLFKYLDSRCRCSFRVISEERGMRSFGRISKNNVKSIIGEMFNIQGIDKTFSFIENLCDGAIIDSRVFFAHLRGKVSKKDRFYSDLGLYEKIEDPWVKEFTLRVVNSKIPILTGGHSLILGGLWALVWAYGEITWFY